MHLPTATPMPAVGALQTSPLQLDLPFWAKGCLREALAYMSKVRGPNLALDTLRDYREKESWLYRVFGESCKLTDITYEVLVEVWDRERLNPDGLMGCTVRKRLWHLRSAMKMAAARKIISRDDVPDLPELPDDGRPGQRVLPVVEFQHLRLALGDRQRRSADLGFWTGHHTRDINTFRRWMLEPDFEWLDDDGKVMWVGRFWRRNHKNKRCVDTWFPMEPEFRSIASAMIAALPDGQSLITGPIASLAKAFRAACDRCGIAPVTPQRDLRRSFASMLRARGYGEEYIRQAQAHEGSPRFDNTGRFLGVARPTVDTRHYLRMTSDLLATELKKRKP